ncbi:MAG: hypothetical protein Q9216_002082 [Gyalolechia sp. 2 TL-2023]
MDLSPAAVAGESISNQTTSGQATGGNSAAETSMTNVGSSVAKAVNTDPQSLDGPLLRLSDAIIAELTSSLQDLERARRYKSRESLDVVLQNAHSFRDTLEVRVQQYDASLKQMRDGTYKLHKDYSNRAAALEALNATYEKKLEEIKRLRDEETDTRSKLAKLSSVQQSARKDLNWATERVKITMKEVEEMKVPMEQERKKIEQEAKGLEARRTTLQQQEQTVEKTRKIIAVKSKEHNDREASLRESELITQQGLRQHNDRLRTLDNAMAALHSTLNFVALPATYESIERDAEAIAQEVDEKIKTLLQQTSDLRGETTELTRQLSDKSIAVQKHQRQLREAASGKQQLVESTHALEGTITQLRATLGLKEEEFEAQRSESSRLKAENNGYAEELAARDSKMSGLNDRVALLEEEGSKLQSANDDLKMRSEQQVQELETMTDQLKGEKDTVQSLQALNRDLQYEHDQKVQQLEAVTAEALASKKRPQGEIDRVEELQKLNQDLIVRFRKVQEELATMGSEITKLTKSTGLLQGEEHTHKSRIQELESRLRSFEAQKSGAEWEAEVAQLQEELDKDKEQITQMKNEASTHRESLLRFERDKRDSNKRLSGFESEVSKGLSQIKSLQARITAFETHLPPGHESSLTEQSRADSFESDIQAVQQNLGDSVKEKESALERVADLERRLAEAESKLRSHEATSSAESQASHGWIRQLGRPHAKEMDPQPRIDRLVAQLRNSDRAEGEVDPQWSHGDTEEVESFRVQVEESPELRGRLLERYICRE